jgi:hypothetical protein
MFARTVLPRLRPRIPLSKILGQQTRYKIFPISNTVKKFFCTATTDDYTPDDNDFNIKRFTLEIPEALLAAATVAGKLPQGDKPTISVVSLPVNPALTSEDAIQKLLSEKGFEGGNTVFLSVDPTNYIYNNRIYQKNFNKKIKNVEVERLSMDPVYPLYPEETLLNANLMDFYYRSNLAIDRPKNFKTIEEKFFKKHKVEADPKNPQTAYADLGATNDFLLIDRYNTLIEELGRIPDPTSANYTKKCEEMSEIVDYITPLIIWDPKYVTSDMNMITRHL